MSERQRVNMSERFETVEQLVRSRLAEAFGGGRGVAEAAAPTIAFTVAWILTEDLRRSLTISIGLAVVLLLIRIVQRSNIQFVLNAAIGIGIAALVASRTGEARDVFLPGIIYNSVYAVVIAVTILVGWPVVGFLIGAITGDPTGWHDDKPLVRLCSRLSWLLVAPCIARVVVQYPLYLADEVALLGTAKVIMGWPLQVASFLAMAWVLSRNSTPIEDE